MIPITNAVVSKEHKLTFELDPSVGPTEDILYQIIWGGKNAGTTPIKTIGVGAARQGNDPVKCMIDLSNFVFEEGVKYHVRLALDDAAGHPTWVQADMKAINPKEWFKWLLLAPVVLFLAALTIIWLHYRNSDHLKHVSGGTNTVTEFVTNTVTVIQTNTFNQTNTVTVTNVAVGVTNTAANVTNKTSAGTPEKPKQDQDKGNGNFMMDNTGGTVGDVTMKVHVNNHDRTYNYYYINSNQTAVVQASAPLAPAPMPVQAPTVKHWWDGKTPANVHDLLENCRGPIPSGTRIVIHKFVAGGSDAQFILPMDGWDINPITENSTPENVNRVQELAYNNGTLDSPNWIAPGSPSGDRANQIVSVWYHSLDSQGLQISFELKRR